MSANRPTNSEAGENTAACHTGGATGTEDLGECAIEDREDEEREEGKEGEKGEEGDKSEEGDKGGEDKGDEGDQKGSGELDFRRISPQIKTTKSLIAMELAGEITPDIPQELHGSSSASVATPSLATLSLSTPSLATDRLPPETGNTANDDKKAYAPGWDDYPYRVW